MSEQLIDHRAYFAGLGWNVSDTGEVMTRDTPSGQVQFMMCNWRRSAPHDRRWTALLMEAKSGMHAQDHVVTFDDNQTDPVAAYALAELRGWRRVGGGDAQ